MHSYDFKDTYVTKSACGQAKDILQIDTIGTEHIATYVCICDLKIVGT